MATQINLRKLLHRKQWEMCSPAPVATAAGIFARFLDLPDYNLSLGWLCGGLNTHYLYDAKEDSWQQLIASSSGGAFAAGACGRISPIGTSGTATAGTTSTITTNLTIPHDLRGYKIRITGGPSAAGQELTILSNTIGANSVITVAAQAAAFTTATTYTLLTPTFWYFCPGTSAVGFNVYDWALNTWTTRSVTNLPTSFGTDGLLVSTEGIRSAPSETNAGKTFGSCTTTVLTLSAGAAWATNQWANSQLRVTGGTGAGQIRTIASSTAARTPTDGKWSFGQAHSQYFADVGAFKGYISHFLWFDSFLSDSDKKKVEGFLAHAANELGVLPENHPYKTAYPTV